MEREGLNMDDLISRKGAIEKFNCVDPDGTFAYCSSIIKTLMELPPAEPGWIPCSERLPAENEGEVLVYLYNPPTPYIAWVRDGHWLTEDFEVEKDYDPDAWMPLPKPYERSEE